MKKITVMTLLLLSAGSVFSQSRFLKNELILNGFRNPSIGAEYRVNQVSVHTGYYLANFESGVTTRFLKTGLTYWFLRSAKKKTHPLFMHLYHMQEECPKITGARMQP